MARNQHVSGHADRLAGFARSVSALAREVARLRTVLMRDALIAPGYRLEHRPDADPPGLYIVNTRSHHDEGNAEVASDQDTARFLCP